MCLSRDPDPMRKPGERPSGGSQALSVHRMDRGSLGMLGGSSARRDAEARLTAGPQIFLGGARLSPVEAATSRARGLPSRLPLGRVTAYVARGNGAVARRPVRPRSIGGLRLRRKVVHRRGAVRGHIQTTMSTTGRWATAHTPPRIWAVSPRCVVSIPTWPSCHHSTSQETGDSSDRHRGSLRGFLLR
jgi:hypothetical protein